MSGTNSSLIAQPRLWREEIEILIETAKNVPAEGRILEIGTADGATTRLLAEATVAKNIQIFTVDPFPSPLAYEMTRDLPIEILKTTSAHAATRWKHEKLPPFDMIFIDGSHQFHDVFDDYNALYGLMREGGVMVFHDYDPPARGGLAHLGVRIVAESIERENLLGKTRHEAKLLIGSVHKATRALSLPECIKTWKEIEQGIDRALLGFENNHELALTSLRQRVPFYDSVTACRILNHYLPSAYSELDSQASDSDDFRRRTEILVALEYGFLPQWNLPNHAEQFMSLLDFSRLVERHQVRNRLLAEILRLFVSWNI